MELAIGTKVEAIRDMAVYDVEDDSKNYELKEGRRGVITEIDEIDDFNYRPCYIFDFDGDEAFVLVEKFDSMFKVVA